MERAAEAMRRAAEVIDSRGVRGCAALIAVIGWAVAASMMLWPRETETGHVDAEDREVIRCPLPAGEEYSDIGYHSPSDNAMELHCAQRHDRGPLIALTALVATAPAAAIWLHPRPRTDPR